MIGNNPQMISTGVSEPQAGISARPYPRATDYTRTTVTERLLLVALIVMLPLQENLPTLEGMSFSYILFGLTFVHIVLNRPKVLTRTWGDPVFLALYALFYLGIVIESAHPYANYKISERIGEMIGGAILVASICRDRKALQAGMNGYLLAGVWLSILLFMTSYGALRGATAADFKEASTIREEAFEENPLEAGLNRMAVVAAQGCAVALAFAIATKDPRKRFLFLGLCAFCTVAAFLPVSRSGVINVAISCAAVLLAYQGRGKWSRILTTVTVIAAAILIFVPGVVYSRMTYTTETDSKGRQDGRARVYTASMQYLDEYFILGVGSGNFATSWGLSHGYVSRGGNALGAHNALFQVTIFWGMFGLLAVLLTLWLAYRALPRNYGDDVLAIGLKGIAMTVFLLLMVVHALYAKEYSLGLGMIVGARRWVWPRREYQSEQ